MEQHYGRARADPLNIEMHRTTLADMTVIDVSEQDFQAEVLDRSATVPVVVDFWAEWCGPCRSLSPTLERAAADREGKVVLAKVDTDANPNLAAQFQIQGIPAVKAFRNGEVVDEFVGAQPPSNVERFFDGLVPTEADGLVAAGDEASLRRAVELEPARADARVRLAGILHKRGDSEEALQHLDNASGDFTAEGLASRIRLERQSVPGVDDAFKALDAGDPKQAVNLLIDALAESDGNKDDLRRVIVALLDAFGVDHPFARESRRRLAAALY
jgi:putative thioredoxin